MPGEEPARQPRSRHAAPPATDGRRTRWDAHRAERREQLTTAGLEVLAEVGVDFGLEQVAERAGVTKPVIYRHFTDRAALVEAMGQRAMTELLDERILPRIAVAGPLLNRIRSTIDAFLGFLEDHPNVYWLFVTPHHGPPDEVGEIKDLIAATLSAVLGDFLRAGEGDAGAAEVWAHGLVGLVQNTTEWWLERQTMTRHSLTDYLTTLVWAQIDGLARQYGVLLDPDETLSPETVAERVTAIRASSGRGATG